MNDLITLDEITPLTLPDGEQLDARQSLAITLRATSTLNIDEIAKAKAMGKSKKKLKALLGQLG